MIEHIQHRGPQRKKSPCNIRRQAAGQPFIARWPSLRINQHGTSRVLLTQLRMIEVQVVGTANLGPNEKAIGYTRYMNTNETQAD
ncbi:hypothetical protein D3C73_1420110 [compost metagenome]